MPRPTHRIDLVAVPAVPDDYPIEGARELLRSLQHAGIITSDGAPGPAAATWMDSGFGRVRIDGPGGVVLYANRLGGFRVSCPTTGGPIVPAFSAAMTTWREGGPRELACPACGETHPLEALSFAPPAALGRLAIVTVDAGSATPSDQARALVQACIPDIRWVVTRV